MARPRNVVIVGPTHPHTGGIAQHDTRLAHELAARGVHTRVESWRAQYPKRSRNGLGELAQDKPELPIFPEVTERLKWYSPASWVSLRGRLASADTVVFAVVTPFHAVPYAWSALGKTVPKRIAIVHNVVPHESSRVDRLLMRWLLKRMDQIIVHNDSQADLARALGVAPHRIAVAALPFPGIAEPDDIPRPPRLDSDDPLRLLFFGMVRRYKGLDHLLEALALTDDATLEVAGHFWEDIETYRAHIRELGLDTRVTLRDGYVDASEIPELFSRSDVLVLPYRSGTSSIVSDLAFAHKRPVIVSDVGDLADEIDDSVTGLVVPPLDKPALARAIEHMADRTRLARMADAVAQRPDKSAAEWSLYVSTVLDDSGPA
ncbi:glycosyltransferase family 4 protein [Microcella indica]|jgi:glycosyltransferase involved in cell wall biosynthesis|uniref:glycosyltransferase family 4 protein n=1 Tax=Microcella indica TaxID=2750620 RepID=UPI0015CF6A7C|nr:glycosyltransferase family 4 protein [Microcella indica]